ncbi:MAG: ubiquinol-cytochrome c reductase cytochrome b subunit, partial [Acidimicrobiia bacterium]|nr:ubiquinol-cytochrome c reductase cytochrome b subunit [Acidimicrobiia bacterium]
MTEIVDSAAPEASADTPHRRGLVERYVDSVAGRVGAGSGLPKALRKVFPHHFSFLWGEIALYCFVVLLVTGTYLTLFYEGTQQTVVYDGSYEALQGLDMSGAYDSVLRISFDVKGGLLIRQMHHWAALVFVGAIALHLARVFFTGAFRRPREINWVVGVLLLILSLAAGFSGYSLPDDLLSGTGLRITQAAILALPFIGERATYLLFGGEWPGTDIIGRLYPVHILFLPAAIVALLGVHLGLVWRQKHTHFGGRGATEHNVIGERIWPTFAMKSVGLLFLVAGMIAAMGALFEVNAVWLYGPYDVGAATSYSQPDWYIGFLEGSLRLFPPWETRIGGFMINNLIYSAVLIPGFIFTGLLLVPWIERRFSRDRREHHVLDRPRDAPHRTAAGAAAITFVSVLFLGGSQEVIAGTLDMSISYVTTVLQVAALGGPPMAYAVTLQLCAVLRRREGPERTERAGVVVRDAGGGYHGVG